MHLSTLLWSSATTAIVYAHHFCAREQTFAKRDWLKRLEICEKHGDLIRCDPRNVFAVELAHAFSSSPLLTNRNLKARLRIPPELVCIVRLCCRSEDLEGSRVGTARGRTMSLDIS